MPYCQKIDTSIQIVTPENIAFRYQLAGPFQRLPAFLIDFGVRVVMLFVVALVLMILGIISQALSAALLLLTYFCITWFYGVLFETYWSGQTPGKRMLNLRVVTDQGRPINGEQAVLRNLVRLADISFPLVSLIAASRSRCCQRLGDLVAGTMVIREEPHHLTKVVEFEDLELSQLVAALPVNMQTTRSLADCLRSYVEGRGRLNSSQRLEIAAHLAVPLLARYDLPRTTDHDMLLCAMYFRVFVRDHVAVTASPIRTDEHPLVSTGAVTKTAEVASVVVPAKRVSGGMDEGS